MDEKKKITIDVSDENEVDMVTTGLDTDEVGSLLLQSYLQIARSILRDHDCGEPRCMLKHSTRELVGTIMSVVNMHELSHRKE